jgi:magnesium chelatase family protein
MLAKVTSGAVVGLEAVPVEVEVDIASQGFPAFSIVGLPDKAIEEAKERVRSALKNTQIKFPDRRITVNLSPADLPKRGPAYDFPISMGILLASGEMNFLDLSDSVILGELSLDGSLRHTPAYCPLF